MKDASASEMNVMMPCVLSVPVLVRLDYLKRDSRCVFKNRGGRAMLIKIGEHCTRMSMCD